MLKDSLWKYSLFIILVLLLCTVFRPTFHPPRQSAYRASCQSNLKRIGLAMAQYTKDYDQCYPRVSMNDAAITPQRPLGWADALQPYMDSIQVFRCPSEKVQETNDNPNGLNYTDYWFNARLSGAYVTQIKQKQSVFLAGEGNDRTDATNARYSLSNLPPNWRTNEDSPAYRHLEGANYAFSNGHVKWIKTEQITDKKPNARNYTFAVK